MGMRMMKTTGRRMGIRDGQGIMEVGIITPVEMIAMMMISDLVMEEIEVEGMPEVV
jgi:hypothetical protein